MVYEIAGLQSAGDFFLAFLPAAAVYLWRQTFIPQSLPTMHSTEKRFKKMGAVPARDTFLRIVGDGGLPTRAQIFPPSKFFLMANQEKQLTPAQLALLDFCNQAEPYQYLSTTLSVCIGNYMKRFDDDPEPAGPTPKVLEAWYFTVDLLALLHDIAAEASAPGQ